MEHQALYRTFRPETFSDLCGQEAIVTALKHQIENGTCAHAYLFCGTRGTGKTTTARLLARAVNCLNPIGAEPCNECEACKSIKNGTAIDVVEIDAASNTSVDNVRQIREEIAYPPMSLKRKVYIIDEVHMLSGGAFNALLKTLEEPPEYAMFILATTEYHKVPATILSRCQRFDFKRISGKTIADRLKYVCDESGAKYENDAISAVAYAADGSMRDGLSILEKCLSFSNETLTADAVANVIGTVDDSDLFRLSGAIADKNAAEAIEVCEKSIAEGRDPLLLTVYLMEHFRCLMVASMVKNPEEILQMNSERAQMFKMHSQKFALPQIIMILKSLSNVYKSQKETPNPKMMVEIGIAAICVHGTKPTISAGGGAALPPFAKPQTASAAPAPSVPNPIAKPAAPEMSAPAAPSAPQATPQSAQPIEPPAPTLEPSENFPPEPLENGESNWQPEEPPAEAQAEQPIGQPNESVAEQTDEKADAQPSVPPEEQTRMAKHGSMEDILSSWSDITEYLMREKKMALCSNLRLCRPVIEKDNVLMLIFRPENKINHDLVDRQPNKEALCEAIWQYTGLKPKIHCCYADESAAQAQQVQPAADLSALEEEFGDFIKFED